jgi:hypothetical protein
VLDDHRWHLWKRKAPKGKSSISIYWEHTPFCENFTLRFQPTNMTVLHLVPTTRFCVFDVKTTTSQKKEDSSTKKVECSHANNNAKENKTTTKSQTETTTSSSSLPIMNVSDLLLHKERQISKQVHQSLLQALQKHGYIFLQFSSNSAPGLVIDAMRQAMETQLFPNSTPHSALLPTSDVIYISERGVPMWKLGYERSEDGIREFFRIHGGCVDDQPWPDINIDTTMDNNSFRSTWLQGLALCRHVCDEALELLLPPPMDQKQPATPNPNNIRPSKGKSTWLSPSKYSQTPIGKIPDRAGDFSVLYAMHYFNQTHLDLEDDDDDKKNSNDHGSNNNNNSNNNNSLKINVKEHVDPSLLVLEPFLCPHERGLQVFDAFVKEWIDCDGPLSPVHGQTVMCLFAGKAFCRHVPSVQPTLHRVVASTGSRRSIVYEQKYEEYWD